MLNKMKDQARGILGFGIIGLLVIAFGAWGLADVAVDFTSDTVARLGSHEIRANEFRLLYRNRLQQLSRDLPEPISPEQGRSLGLDLELMGDILDARSVSLGAEDMGLRIPNTVVRQALLQDAAFFGPNGKFDEPTFRRKLALSGLSEKLYVQDQRQYALREQFLNAFNMSTFYPPSIIRQLYLYQNEKRKAQYARLPTSITGDPGAPEAGQLEEFYTNTRLRWRQAEHRSATILQIDGNAFGQNITIDEQELRDEFERVSEQYATPEQRAVDQLMLPDEQSEAEIRVLRDKGKGFEDFVKAAGNRLENVDLGIVARNDFIVPELAEAAFSLKKGAVSDIIQTPLGGAIVRVRDIIPGKRSSYKDIRDDIRTRMLQERVREELYAFYQNIEDELAASASFEDLAKQFDLPLITITDIDKDGMPRKGKRPAILETEASLTEAIFSSAVEESVPPIESSDRSFYWIRVDKIEPAHIAEFEEVKDEVKAAWEESEQRETLETLARTLVERGNRDTPFAQLLDGTKARIQKSALLARDSESNTDAMLDGEALSALFDIEQIGGFAWAHGKTRDEVVVIQLSEIVPPQVDFEKITADPEADPEAKPAPQDAEARRNFQRFTNRTHRLFRNNMHSQFMQRLRQHYGAEIDYLALEAASGFLP